jgi:hypothetical protein
MLPVNAPQLKAAHHVSQEVRPLSLWPALRSATLLLASIGLTLIGMLSVVGPSNSLSDRALRRACYSLDDFRVVGSCSAPFYLPGSVDLDVAAAFLLAGVMGALFLWSMHGYWQLYARGIAGLARRLFVS